MTKQTKIVLASVGGGFVALCMICCGIGAIIGGSGIDDNPDEFAKKFPPDKRKNFDQDKGHMIVGYTEFDYTKANVKIQWKSKYPIAEGQPFGGLGAMLFSGTFDLGGSPIAPSEALRRLKGAK